MRGPSKRFRKPLTIFVVAALLLASPFGVRYFAARAEYAADAATLPAETARARELGLALTWDDLTPSWAGTDQDAAPLYKKASDLYKQLPVESRIGSFPEGPSATRDWDKRQAALHASRDVLALIDQAATRPRCWFIQNPAPFGRDPGFPSPLVDLKKLACGRAELDAHDGRFDAALESLRIAATIARHSGENPGLIRWLVKVNLDGIVLEMLNRSLVPSAMTPSRIERARTVIDTLGSPSPMQALRGELVSRLTIYDVVRDDLRRDALREPPSISGRLQEWWRRVKRTWVGEEPEGVDLTAFLPRLQDPAVVEQAYQARELHRWNALFEVIQKHVEDPLAVRQDLAALETALASGRHRADRAARVFPMRADTMGDQFQRLVARRRLTGQALTVMGFRHRTGQWPATLAETGEPFADPFDGKPLRYLPRADGFVVYSIGKDGVDGKGGKGNEAFEFPVK